MGAGVTWDHGRYNFGTNGFYYRFADGTGFAFLFNSASKDGTQPSAFTAQVLAGTIAQVAEWPEHDLFLQYAPPRIAPAGVVNAASFRAGAVAAGSVIAILGADLGGRDSGVEIRLRGMEQLLPVLFSRPGQIDTILPREAALGEGAVISQRTGWPEGVAPVIIARSAPGLFGSVSILRSTPGQSPSAELVPADGIAFGEDAAEQLLLVLYGTGIH